MTRRPMARGSMLAGLVVLGGCAGKPPAVTAVAEPVPQVVMLPPAAVAAAAPSPGGAASVPPAAVPKKRRAVPSAPKASTVGVVKPAAIAPAALGPSIDY